MLSRILALVAIVTAGLLAQAVSLPLSVAFLGLNLCALFAFWRDKRRAQHGGHRTPEWVLHAWTLALGAAGASLGRLLFRHKTLKPVFSLVSMLGIAEMLVLLRFLG